MPALHSIEIPHMWDYFETLGVVAEGSPTFFPQTGWWTVEVSPPFPYLLSWYQNRHTVRLPSMVSKCNGADPDRNTFRVVALPTHSRKRWCPNLTKHVTLEYLEFKI